MKFRLAYGPAPRSLVKSAHLSVSHFDERNIESRIHAGADTRRNVLAQTLRGIPRQLWAQGPGLTPSTVWATVGALMAYMLLMVEPVGQRQARTEAEGRDAYASMVRWGESLHQRGLLLGAESLRSQDSASRVTRRAGHAHVIDGPFAETKEMIGGFFLVSCTTQAEALELAKECPAAEWLTVEVRGLAACFEESQSPS
jgi:hypothetical protein